MLNNAWNMGRCCGYWMVLWIMDNALKYALNKGLILT